MRELRPPLPRQIHKSVLVLLASVLLLAACATPLKLHPQPERFALPPGPVAVEWEVLQSNLPTIEATSWFDIQGILARNTAGVSCWVKTGS